MQRPEAWEIFEVNYDGFLARYLEDMQDSGYSFEEACIAWIDWFGYDSQDPLVDYAMENYWEWAMPDAN